MDNLTKLRMGLTIGAIVGFLPITLLFAGGIVGFFIPLVFVAPNTPFVVLVLIGACIISTFGIWSIWKIYALAMAASPDVRNALLLASGAVSAMIWGLLLAYFTREISEVTCIFLMPGITSTVMLAITLKRVRA
jgi:hypothetical protein